MGSFPRPNKACFSLMSIDIFSKLTLIQNGLSTGLGQPELVDTIAKHQLARIQMYI